MESITVRIAQGLRGGPFTGWVTLPASGVSSGILLMWDKLDVECIEEEVGTFSLSCKFKSVLHQFVWALRP
jgi:hypothetical protein